MRMIMEFTDIHCHLIPYVDDGAKDLKQTYSLLQMMIEQGVRRICFTPHQRHGMFETGQDEIDRRYAEVAEMIQDMQLPLETWHSREYHWDRDFRALLQTGKVRPLGSGDGVLVEFSSRHTEREIKQAINSVRDYGLQPLVAHVERYTPTKERGCSFAEELCEMGAFLQVNMSSYLGREGLRQKVLAHKLVKDEVVYCMASDAHDTKIRIPEFDTCAALLEKKTNRETTERLLNRNPVEILHYHTVKTDF